GARTRAVKTAPEGPAATKSACADDPDRALTVYQMAERTGKTHIRQPRGATAARRAGFVAERTRGPQGAVDALVLVRPNIPGIAGARRELAAAFRPRTAPSTLFVGSS